MGSIEPDVQEARIGCSQPGVGLWSPHFFVLNFFKSGLTLNSHNKRHSFGLFISLCCVVDCINVFSQVADHDINVQTWHPLMAATQ